MSAAPASRRLFVGLEVPAPLAAQALALAGAHLDTPGWRRHVAVDLHLTLLFLGAVPAAARGDIEARLGEELRESGSFELSPGACGGFPQSGRARVAFFAPQPSRELGELGVRIASALAGYAPAAGGSAPTPHVTLARRGRDSFAPLPAAFLSGRLEGAWPVERVLLYESVGGAPGASRYRPLGLFPLSRGASPEG